MYKKNFFILAFLTLLLPIQAISQQISVKWGPQLRDKSGTTTTQIVGSDAGGFFTVRTNTAGDDMFLERYNGDNNLLSSQKIEITPASKSERISYENMFYLKGNLILFTKHIDKKADKSSIKAYKLSPQGVLIGSPVEIDALEGDGSTKVDFSISISEDSSKVLVYHRQRKKRREVEGFSLKLLDNSLKTVWIKDVELDKLNKDVMLTNFTVDNNNTAYMLMSVVKDKADKKSDEQSYNYVIMAFNDQQPLKEYKIEMPGKFITNIKFKVAANNNLIVAGMYANNNKRPFFSAGISDASKYGSSNDYSFSTSLVKASGIFYMIVDPNSQMVIKTSQKEFDDKFIQEFGRGNNKKVSPEKKGIAHLILKDMILREDGGAILIAEESFYIVKRSKSSGMNGMSTYSTTYEYFRGPIVAVNINTEGNIDWITSINKKQRSDTRDFLSYSFAVNKDEILFLFNDHVKNLNINEYKKQKWMTNPKKSATILVSLSNKGQYSKTFMFPAKERRTIFYPSFYLQNNNKIIMHSIRGRAYRFGSAEM